MGCVGRCVACLVLGVSDVPARGFCSDDGSDDLDLFLMTPQGHHELLTPPSPWVGRWAALIPPGSHVLDLACGNGRHMRLLTALGLKVTGVDKSLAALQMASQFGQVLAADLEDGEWPFEPHQFDAIVVTNYLWRPLFASIQNSIKPKGFLIYETFATGNESLGKPSSPNFLLNTLELITGFPQMTPIAYENGLLGEPSRIVQRIFAFKPSSEHDGARQAFQLDSLKCDLQPKASL
jgi:SAM-dependent methyltransferase